MGQVPVHYQFRTHWPPGGPGLRETSVGVPGALTPRENFPLDSHALLAPLRLGTLALKPQKELCKLM